MIKIIYLDNSATTPMDNKVIELSYKLSREIYGNPSSLHRAGQNSRKYIDEARENIAMYLKAKSREIIFTSSGSEGNNMAIRGIAKSEKYKGNEIITSPIEHASVRNTLKILANEGFIIKEAEVDKNGNIKIDELEKLINKNTRLISIIHGNNEIGTIQNIKKIGELSKKNNIIFHIDAVQSFGKMLIYPEELGVDLMTISSHKLYGPKGMGALYIKSGTNLKKLIEGGPQERNRRGGTENIIGICAFSKAVETAYSLLYEENQRIEELRNYMENSILEKIPYVSINGSIKNRLPNISSLTIKDIQGESLMYSLDIKNVCISTGSACSSGTIKASPILQKIGLDKKQALSTIRISLGRFNTREEIDNFVEILETAVYKERNMADLY